MRGAWRRSPTLRLGPMPELDVDPDRGPRLAPALTLLVIPLLGLAVLLAVPELDGRWEHHPAHFWLVLGVAVVNVVLGFATGEAAARRGDTRIFLVSLALLVSAGFLGLHALATPGVLLEGRNVGFTIATPVGLVLASGFAAASAWVPEDRRATGSRTQRRVRLVVLVVVLAWAVASVTGFPLLDDPPEGQELPGPLRVLAPLAIVLYAVAAWRYLRLARTRRDTLPLAVAAAWILLAEAMVAILVARSWHATWWEWHLLMAAAFATVLVAARRQYREQGSVAEAFAGLYQDRTLQLVDQRSSEALDTFVRAMRSGAPLEPVRDHLRASGLTGERLTALERAALELRRVDDLLQGYVGSRVAMEVASQPERAALGGRVEEVSVLFADLVGFTSYSERRPPEAGMTLLNTYWEAVVPRIVDDHGGVVERFAGDGIVVIFNAFGDQPDHARRAARCAIMVQETIEGLSAGHEGWPRFRIGINSGPAVVGNVGAEQRRNLTVIGDTANTAARFEALAPPGGILIGGTTYDGIRDELAAEPRGTVELKGKARPVAIYELPVAGARDT
jgi:adenylate cyclase